MKITKEIIEALEKAKTMIKFIEAYDIPEEERAESAWLIAINDIIDRTALAFRNELEWIK